MENISEILKKKIKDMTDDEKKLCITDWIIRNLNRLAEEYPRFRNDVNLAIYCIRNNLVNIFNIDGVELTKELCQDQKALVLWAFYLIHHCEKITGFISKKEAK